MYVFIEQINLLAYVFEPCSGLILIFTRVQQQLHTEENTAVTEICLTN
jgi:hypothetical protein